MAILNFGSLNIDHVYSVEHFVRPGETLASQNYRVFAGGKGANQSIALARAGANVYHAGRLGKDGEWLKRNLMRSGVNTKYLLIDDCPSGHAVIQVNSAGENAIILHGGANQAIGPTHVDSVLKDFTAGDTLLLQNEISSIPYVIKQAKKQGLKIAFNPAPMGPEVHDYPLDLVDFFIVNEIEGQELSGEQEPEAIADAMHLKYRDSCVVLTLGSKGALLVADDVRIRTNAQKVNAVDTTAAGDTFIGYFLAAMDHGKMADEALKLACKAAGICVTRKGASDSIPTRDEVLG